MFCIKKAPEEILKSADRSGTSRPTVLGPKRRSVPELAIGMHANGDGNVIWIAMFLCIKLSVGAIHISLSHTVSMRIMRF
jgi:hypothetical protein